MKSNATNRSILFKPGGCIALFSMRVFRADGKPYGRKNFQWNDANIPQQQVEWLAADLKTAAKPTVVFVHQRLDVANAYGVKNAAQVRKVLEESGNVRAVLQGHSHKNDVQEINGIHYCVHRAMVEGAGEEDNGYSVMDVFDNGLIRITGFRKQAKYDWT